MAQPHPMTRSPALFLLAASFVGALGCSGGGPVPPLPPVPPLRTPFHEADYALYAGEGTASIVGQAVLKLPDGEVMKGEGCQVQLTPVTPYSKEWFDRSIVLRQVLDAPDPRIHAYIRNTVADKEGRFEFTNLPPGEYYLTCRVTWTFERQGHRWQNGVVVFGEAKVGPDEQVEVVLAR